MVFLAVVKDFVRLAWIKIYSLMKIVPMPKPLQATSTKKSYNLLTNVPSIGKNIVAVAVLEVTSVNAHNMDAVISTITNVGTLSSLASC